MKKTIFRYYPLDGVHRTVGGLRCKISAENLVGKTLGWTAPEGLVDGYVVKVDAQSDVTLVDFVQAGSWTEAKDRWAVIVKEQSFGVSSIIIDQIEGRR